MRTRNNLLSVQAGEIPTTEAAPFLAESADVARRGGDEHFLAQMLLQLADNYFEAGSWAEMESPLEELAGMNRSRHHRDRAFFRGERAMPAP
jgi:hypothetical protein